MKEEKPYVFRKKITSILDVVTNISWHGGGGMVVVDFSS